MNKFLTSMNEWFSERPKWLNIAADRLSQGAELDEIVSESVTDCLEEAKGKLTKTTYFCSDDNFPQDTTGTLRLSSVSKIKGINNLAPTKRLKFGEDKLTIVYGNNGSGKSGYVRLLKHICGAREKGILLPNVFEPDSVKQSAYIAYKQREENEKDIEWPNLDEKVIEWPSLEDSKDLSSVKFYDIQSSKAFVHSEKELEFEPPELAFFSLLIEICKKVTDDPKIMIEQVPLMKLNIPTGMKGTDQDKWYGSISEDTTRKEVDEYCTYSDTNDTERLSLEQCLREPEPAKRTQQLRTHKEYLERLILQAKESLEQLSDEKCQKIIASRKKLSDLKAASAVAMKSDFSDSELKGIGSETWKVLWEAARNYSETAAYKESSYPNVSNDSRCVLCLQLLTDEARNRLTTFENFVKNEIQTAVQNAHKEYEDVIKPIHDLTDLDTLKLWFVAAGISQEEIGNHAMTFFDQMNARKDKCLKTDAKEAIPKSLPSFKWIEVASDRSQKLSDQITKQEKHSQQNNWKEMEQNLRELEAKKWLFENRTVIYGEVEQLEMIQKISELTNTTALSKKKGELANDLLTDKFAHRFNEELNDLSASHLKVEVIKTKVKKGQVLHKLQLRGAIGNDEVSDVLSEGEQRIVSIAAFLADIRGNSNQAPLIFDDPISSLDQIYEEAVAKRLLMLSNDRQVILFTHRLSLLKTVQRISNNNQIKTNEILISTENWGSGEPGPLKLSQKKISKALESLIICCQKAKKLQYDGSSECDDMLVGAVCCEFRNLLERSIEEDLICDVVSRFRFSVSTKNLNCLAKLKPQDCFILDSLMTKFSKYAHSHSSESPVDLPKADKLLDDLMSLKKWREEYNIRSAPLRTSE